MWGRMQQTKVHRSLQHRPCLCGGAVLVQPFRAAGNSSSGDGSDDGGMVDITVAELSEV